MEVITLYEDVIRCILIFRQDTTFGYFGKNGKLLAQQLLHIFLVVLPHQAILFLLVQKREQIATLFIAYAIKFTYKNSERHFVYVSSCHSC